MLASTPMPMERIIPAIPGRVRVEELMPGKKPVKAAIISATCPIRAMTATTPGSRYTASIKMQISTKAITAARIIASRAPSPMVGSMVE